MIQGYRSIDKLDPIHQDQHRILFQGCLGVIEKLAISAPTSLPIGYIQFAYISSKYYIYANINGALVRWEGTAV